MHPAGAAPAVAGHPSPAVCIFHADKDEFCPESQRLTLEQTGAQCQLMRDTHDLMAPPSKEAISRAFAGLLARATTASVPAGQRRDSFARKYTHTHPAQA